MDSSPTSLTPELTTAQITSPKSPFHQTRTRSIKVWKLKLTAKWRAFKSALSRIFKQQPRRRLLIRQSKNNTIAPLAKINEDKPLRTARPHKSLARLLQVPYSADDFIDWGDRMTPTLSPKMDISSKWRELHGDGDWAGEGEGEGSLLSPLYPCLRREILKYGELATATYDGFDFDPLSEFCGSCRFNHNKLLQELGLADKHGYRVTRYIYAMSHVDVPDWLASTYTTWSKDSNWMGYVAVSDDLESKRIGRRDIVVAWRGTVAPTEWFSDLKAKLVRVNDVKEVKVQEGFLSVYKSKGEFTRYNKWSASEQVIDELIKLVKLYRDERKEEISLTITGHSLGGALALLTAYEAAILIPNVFISVISFGGPRVGNLAFREKLKELGVKVLRVVVDQDIVPDLPGIIINTILKKLSLSNRINWIYRHVGRELKLDIRASPYLKQDSDLSGSHNMEVYLHLLDGFVSTKSKFRWNSRRDLALVNKNTDRLIEELKIPEFWYDMPYKGLVLNKHGRWVKPGRQPEDIPTPLFTEDSNHRPVLQIVDD
ncbi:Phospholipase A1-Igamma1, chloroplastic [Linum perenne]